MKVQSIYRRSRLTLLTACVALGFAVSAGANEAPPPIVDQGAGWQLVLVQPDADDQGLGVLSGEAVPMVMIDSAEGLAQSPLPESIKQELAGDFAGAGDDISIAVHYDIAEAIANGTAEFDYADDLVPDEDGEQGAAFLGCSTDWRHRRNSYTRSFEGIHYNRQFNSGGFTGSIQVDAPLTGGGAIEVEYAFKKTAFCLPYTVKFVHARAQAELHVDNTVIHAQGKARYETSDREELAKPKFSQSFMIGPVPVVLGVEFPLGAGYAVSADAAVDVKLNSRAQGSMHLDVLCTADGCSKNPNGNNSSTVSFGDLLAPDNAESSARFQVDFKPYAYVEARAYLYHPSVASAGVGAEISAPSRLFYHIGSCGPDSVNGGYVDVGAQLEFYWNATLLGSDRFNWIDTPINGVGPFRKVHVNQFLRGGRAHEALRAKLYFTEFSSGRSPLSPVLTVPASVTQGHPGSYSVVTRPCVPLDETLNYAISWGDGSQTETFTGTPAQTVSRSHTYGSGGNRTITATLVSDHADRTFNKATTRTVSVIATVPPPVPAGITVPATDADGSFPVSWSGSSNATSYKLFHRKQTGNTWGAWSLIKTVTGTSTSLTGQPFGSNQYGVQACNVYGCSSSRTSSVMLIGVVPTAPSLTVTSALCYGLNDVSWTAPSGATSYRLYTSAGTNPNNAGQVYSGSNRHYALNVSSTTNVWVKACGSGGCGNFSAMRTANRLATCM